jgi:hypothetical protein
MSISSIVGRVLPAATAFVTSGGNPLAAATSFVASDQARDQAKRVRMQQARERDQLMEYFGSSGSSIPTIQSNLARTQPQIMTGQADSGFLSTLRGGLREVGGLVSDVFASGLPQLFGKQRPAGIAQQPAVTTVTNVGAQESQGSGSIQAGLGAALPSVLGGARSLLKSPLGQLALGGGTGLALSGLGGQPSGMRITRKMKSQARMVLNMTNGNLSAAADILGIDENMLVMILLKRFRNDGPVVTKAALRKTKQTVRRLKSMCDMYDSLRPAATRRRSPMKRATSTTLIKN